MHITFNEKGRIFFGKEFLSFPEDTTTFQFTGNFIVIKTIYELNRTTLMDNTPLMDNTTLMDDGMVRKNYTSITNIEKKITITEIPVNLKYIKEIIKNK